MQRHNDRVVLSLCTTKRREVLSWNDSRTSQLLHAGSSCSCASLSIRTPSQRLDRKRNTGEYSGLILSIPSRPVITIKDTSGVCACFASVFVFRSGG